MNKKYGLYFVTLASIFFYAPPTNAQSPDLITKTCFGGKEKHWVMVEVVNETAKQAINFCIAASTWDTSGVNIVREFIVAASEGQLELDDVNPPHGFDSRGRKRWPPVTLFTSRCYYTANGSSGVGC